VEVAHANKLPSDLSFLLRAKKQGVAFISLIYNEEFLYNFTIVKKLCDWKNVKHFALVTAHTNLESPVSGSNIVIIPFLPTIPSGSINVWEFGVFVKEDSIKSFILLFSSFLNEKPSVTFYLF